MTGSMIATFPNVIAENLYLWVDSQGNLFLVLEDIQYHRSDGKDISVADGFIIIQGGKKHPKKTTRGWELLTQMKEQFSKWVPLKYLKERKPFKLDYNAVAKNIDLKPSFAWQVSFTLRKQNRMVLKLQKKYC